MEIAMGPLGTKETLPKTYGYNPSELEGLSQVPWTLLKNIEKLNMSDLLFFISFSILFFSKSSAVRFLYTNSQKKKVRIFPLHFVGETFLIGKFYNFEVIFKRKKRNSITPSHSS